ETARGHRALELLRVRRAQRDAGDQKGGVMGGRSDGRTVGRSETLASQSPSDRPTARPSDAALLPIADKVQRNERLTRDDALVLFNSPDLLTIGRLADV